MGLLRCRSPRLVGSSRGQTLHDQVDTQAVGDTETAVSGLHGDWHGWRFGDPLSADPRHAGRSDRLDATVAVLEREVKVTAAGGSSEAGLDSFHAPREYCGTRVVRGANQCPDGTNS